MFTKKILGVFLGVLVPSWLRRFALAPREVTVSGHRSMQFDHAPVAATVAATDAAL